MVYKLDQPGRKKLAGIEQVALIAYKDIEGVWTIGIGMTEYPNGKKVQKGDKLKSEEEAWKLFDQLVQKYVDCVNKFLKVPVTQTQFNVLTSMCYNIGEAGFQNSGLLKAINSGSINSLASEFHKWVGVGIAYENGRKSKLNPEALNVLNLNKGGLHPSEGLYNRRDKEFREFMGWSNNVLN